MRNTQQRRHTACGGGRGCSLVLVANGIRIRMAADMLAGLRFARIALIAIFATTAVQIFLLLLLRLFIFTMIKIWRQARRRIGHCAQRGSQLAAKD